MLKHKVTAVAILGSFLGLGSATAQTVPTGGLYEILSGTYLECCGISGGDTVYSLPDSTQSFINLAFDPQSGTATMTILGPDRATVFSRVPCSLYSAIEFSLPFGFVSTDGVFFHVDPGPPPYEMYWTYTASNSFNSLLRIDGTLGIAAAGCADTPTRFSHSNLVARLVPPPRLSFYGFSTNEAIRLLIQGHPGKTNITEASGDLKTWVPVSTNVMDYSLCPICPYAVFEDQDSTNLSRRFYRVFEE